MHETYRPRSKMIIIIARFEKCLPAQASVRERAIGRPSGVVRRAGYI